MANSELETLRTKLDAALDEAERLKRELKAAKTLDALMSDNGQICELYDEVEALTKERDEARAEVERLKEESDAQMDRADELAVQLKEAHAEIDRMINEHADTLLRLNAEFDELNLLYNEKHREANSLRAKLGEIGQGTADADGANHPLAKLAREALEGTR